ncbi:Hsp70 protein [Nocardia tenerifensis]|uniref:Hsp70 protein n=1 Tax=Nocardia tenerifensis TaxID=228006 RepID=A0A318JZ52_9NOCA|nr:Hsp70 family protein [Nocardia tenerifensis]PXX60262.1 Hsp70 protein [Nocardia tenerifensis]
MTTGLGFSIGAVNSVTASATGARTRPAVRSRRTAVTFDSAGGLRVGGLPQFSMAVTDFADLGRDPEPMIVGGRIWSPANLVAAVVNGLRAAEPAATEAGAVAAYPATYSDKQVSLLRQALDLSGASDVALVPEPVAAAEWLESEHGPLEPGFVLVYDLGGSSLDVTVVRVGADWDNHPMVGKALRSYDFGGRPLGAMIARYAHETGPGTATSTLSMIDIDGLRTAHVRDSLEVVRAAVRSADLTLSDISRILVIGGASRPAEVAGTLAELGRPLVVSADPGQTVAAGAALMAARTMAPAASGGHQQSPRVAVFSSAAVVSAVAMSAVTVFGSPSVPGASPVLEHFPGLDAPATDTLLYDAGPDPTGHRDAWVATPAGWTSSRSLAVGAGKPKPSAYSLFITPVSQAAALGPSIAESHVGSRPEPRTPGTTAKRGGTYANPAYFINPLPFGQPAPWPGQPAVPAAPGQSVTLIAVDPVPVSGSIAVAAPSNSVPSVTDAVSVGPAGIPAAGGLVETSGVGTSTGTAPSAGAGGSTSSGATSSGAGTGVSSGESGTAVSSGETSTGGTTSGGSTRESSDKSSGSTSSGGTTPGGTTSGGTSSGSTSIGTSADSSSGTSTSGSTSGSTTSGGSASEDSTSGGSSSGGSTSESSGDRH